VTNPANYECCTNKSNGNVLAEIFDLWDIFYHFCSLAETEHLVIHPTLTDEEDHAETEHYQQDPVEGV
jgi:hypothetical protein